MNFDVEIQVSEQKFSNLASDKKSKSKKILFIVGTL